MDATLKVILDNVNAKVAGLVADYVDYPTDVSAAHVEAMRQTQTMILQSIVDGVSTTTPTTSPAPSPVKAVAPLPS